MSKAEPPFLPYGRQSIVKADIEAVEAVLRSEFLTQGPAVEQFEQDLCNLTGAARAVAVTNATCALHLACLALGVAAGDLIWTSPNSFVASANCALYCGAVVDFVDIDPVTLNMSAAALETKLIVAQRRDRLPKVVIPVHFAGQPCDMAEIGELSRRFGFKVIEDASHAVGARYGTVPIGACEHSDAVVFSFHPVKIITTAEGGVVMTNDRELADRIALLRSHGITRDPARMRGASEGPWYYQQIALGLNYRLTDMQAALGSSQLTRLDAFLTKRHEIAAQYDAALADSPVSLPQRLPDRFSALHLYVVQLEEPAKRREAFEHLRHAGIGVNVHYIPIHLQPFYRDLGFGPGDFPQAEAYYEAAITLPLHPQMNDDDVVRVATNLQKALA